MSGFPFFFFLVFLLPSVALADMDAANQALKNGDYVRAAEEFRKLAEQGNAKAQSHLGYMYYVGEGVPQSYEEAVKWYGKAAVQGDRDAQYNYAVAYAFGEGIKQDYKEAAIWYRRAAEQGHAIAQYSLGISYTYGEGVPQDEKLAAEWFIKSAEAGYENAQVMVGSLYHTGDGVPKDYTRAVEWYRKAADRGNAVAQYNLGAIYRAGKGVPKNTDEALKWYRLAAAQNYEAAQTELASLERSLAGTRHEKTPAPAVTPPPASEKSVAAKDSPAASTTPTEEKTEAVVNQQSATEPAVVSGEETGIAAAATETEPETTGGLFGNLKNLFKPGTPEDAAQSAETPDQAVPETVAVTPAPLPEHGPEPEPEPALDEVQVEKITPVIKIVEGPEAVAAVPETGIPASPAPDTAKESRKPVFTPGTTATSISEIARPRIEAPGSMQIRTEAAPTSTALIDRPQKETIPEEPVPEPAKPVTEAVITPAVITEVAEPEPDAAPAEAVTEVAVAKPVITEITGVPPVTEQTTAGITTESTPGTTEKTGGLAAFFGRMFSSEEEDKVASPSTDEPVTEEIIVQDKPLATPEQEDETPAAISYAEDTAPATEQLDVEVEERPGGLKSFFGRLFSSEEDSASVIPAEEIAGDTSVIDEPELQAAASGPEQTVSSLPQTDSVAARDRQTTESEVGAATGTGAVDLRGMDELQIARVEIPAPDVSVESEAEQELEQTLPDSIDALMARAVAGNADAQFELGKNYHEGNKVRQDPAQAFLWYRRAALQGNMEAQFTVGNMYLMGEGTEQNDTEARNWYEKAARLGHEKARHNLENLKPVVAEKPAEPPPVEQAVDETSEEKDKKGGVFSLVSGLFSSEEDETGEAPVPAAPVKMPEPAAATPEINTVPGQSDYERGLAYSHGEGVPQNYNNAFKLFESAARLGHASAQYQLALAYTNGHGVTRDPVAAVEWYEKAARQGLAIAQRSLGNAYLNGTGVPANKVMAYAWYSILADQGNVLDIHRRDTIRKQLTEAEIRESESLKQQLSATLSTASTSF